MLKKVIETERDAITEMIACGTEQYAEICDLFAACKGKRRWGFPLFTFIPPRQCTGIWA